MSRLRDRECWYVRASCTQIGVNAFYPGDGLDKARGLAYDRECKAALQVCYGCPVVAECSAEAAKYESLAHFSVHGVWGAEDANSRYRRYLVEGVRGHGRTGEEMRELEAWKRVEREREREERKRETRRKWVERRKRRAAK